MRIGILGGSFDPPHLGHQLIARQTREIIGLDQVWLMPYFAHNWDKTVASVQNRLFMTRLIEEKGIITSDDEVKQGTKNYTINTVRRLKRIYPHEFFWIVGSDVLTEFKRWKEHEQLINEITFLVFPRDNYPIFPTLPAGFKTITSPRLVTLSLSSTIIRKRLMEKLSVAGMISEPVLSYIKEHKLYDY